MVIDASASAGNSRRSDCETIFKDFLSDDCELRLSLFSRDEPREDQMYLLYTRPWPYYVK